MEKRYVVAIVTKPHGIRGEAKLTSLGDDPSELLELEKVYTAQSGDNFLTITKSWRYKDTVCMAFDEVTSREDAEALRGKSLYINTSDMPPLDENAYYLRDLIGCIIKDENCVVLGKIHNVLQHGAADVYVVKGEKNFMMPAVKHVIESVDVEGKVIVVNSISLDEVIVYED